MKVGFTGTQQGVSENRLSYLESKVLTLGVKEFHHGDCIGADAQAHDVIRVLRFIKIVIHPPEKSDKRAFRQGDLHLAKKSYLVRNHDIVDACDSLIAMPNTDKEVIRSGTWSTIRYARKQGKEVIIL